MLCGNWLGSICGPSFPKSRGDYDFTAVFLYPDVHCSGNMSREHFLNINKLYVFPAILSRAAVVCMTLGFIALLSMVIVAIYKSNQQKQMMKGSMKALQGMCISFAFSFVHS